MTGAGPLFEGVLKSARAEHAPQRVQSVRVHGWIFETAGFEPGLERAFVLSDHLATSVVTISNDFI